eukprot:scaffold82903_cov62-Attheya_sp.AAC.1
MMDATQYYSEPLLHSDCDYDAELPSMMKRHDTSSDHVNYETGSHQGYVISTGVTVEESSKEEVESTFKKIIEDGTVTSTFHVGVLFSSMTVLAGSTGEALFLSYANEIRHYFQTLWVACLIFSVLQNLLLLMIMNTARVLILHMLHASRSAHNNEVELKPIAQFLNYQFISG